ncbi:hypothetical protein [Siminovitchia sp. FSL W7-1587]|uniref:hypothetical protein n=1 Tax=Siminovitchia sp. FSL W7-1587 TaxID=2954699 RepID=UPI0030D18FE8
MLIVTEMTNRVEGVTKRTEKEFEVLEKEARKLGKQTKRSCNEAHDALKTLAELGGGRTDKPPLLVIELENETAVPKVFYKGEEMTAKVHVGFDWETRSCEPLSGGMKLNIEHVDKKVKCPNVRQITHKVGKFAFDDE